MRYDDPPSSGAEQNRSRRVDGRLNAAETVALAQGAYFAVTGVWPILHMRSFEAITGRKTDKWLVKTVGAMIGVIGGVLLAAGARRRVTPEIAALGAGTAAALGAVDVIYTARRVIRPVYLGDAVGEALLIGAWAAAAKSVAEGERASA